jgi:hypothetical protein
MRRKWGIAVLRRNWSSVRPIIAIVIGLAVFSLATVDYATSPPQHKGLHVGPLFLQFPGMKSPVAAGHKPVAGHPPATNGGTRPGMNASGLKYPLLGLLDRQGAPSASFYPVLNGYVVNVSWASLQTSAGGPITSSNAIDKAIAQARSASAAGAHLALKVRIFAGIQAPVWAKNIGGAPVAVRDTHSGATGTVGRFWTAAFGQAYQDFETKLAAKYDAVLEIREVTMSRCTTIYDEPFLRQTNDPTSVANLWQAGYTAAADKLCQQQQVQAHTVWHHTRSDLAFNPSEQIYSATQVGVDEAYTEQMMSYCRQVLGSRCIIENNSLRATSMGTRYDQMYAAMTLRGPNIAFQTATMARVGSLSITLGKAVSLYAASVELPFGYQTLGAAAFAAFAPRLAANVGP